MPQRRAGYFSAQVPPDLCLGGTHTMLSRYHRNPPKPALQVKGTFEKNGHALDHPTISGKWDETLTATMPDGSQKVLWQINPPAKQQTR